MLRKWKEKQLQAAFKNAQAVLTGLTDLENKSGGAITHTVAARGLTVVIDTNIPAAYPGRDHVDVVATPYRLIAKGDVVPYGRSAVVSDSVVTSARKPDAAGKVVDFVKSYAVKKGLIK